MFKIFHQTKVLLPVYDKQNGIPNAYLPLTYKKIAL